MNWKQIFRNTIVGYARKNICASFPSTRVYQGKPVK